MPLPTLYLITPDFTGDTTTYLQALSNSLAAGVRLVQLRCKNLSDNVYRTLVPEVLAVCHRYHAKLLLNTSTQAYTALTADGLHLTSARLMACTQRPIATGQLLSAACHNAVQVMHAARIGADFATLSPVLATTTCPESTPLGWETLQTIAATCSLPLYALGGLGRDDLSTAQAYGACGVAAIRGLWEGKLENSSLGLS